MIITINKKQTLLEGLDPALGQAVLATRHVYDFGMVGYQVFGSELISVGADESWFDENYRYTFLEEDCTVIKE